VVCALIEREGLILIAQRPAGKHLAHHWEFPGGKVEPGESPESALIREIREELGGDFVPVSKLPANDHAYPHVTIRLIPIVGHLAAGSPPLVGREHQSIAWVDPRDVADYTLAPADYPVLDAYENQT